MSTWRPTSGPAAAARRAAIAGRLRSYFQRDAVLEVDTPALSPSAASDTQIESIEARSCLTSAPLYLHTSPEFHMKRLLAGGYPDIFSICRVFRDGELGRRHQPEFTMVEWYRHDVDLAGIVDDTVRAIASALERPQMIDSVRHLEYCDTFAAVAGIDPLRASIAELAQAAGADDALVAALGEERDDWLDLILATRVVPTFEANRITVLQHYPASQAALARLCPDDAAVADRFEVFVGALELANGYVELTDARVQSRRIAADLAERKRRNRPIRPHDESLLAALESGLPPCAGVAMGLERLQMIHDDTDDIRDVMTFSFEAADD